MDFVGRDIPSAKDFARSELEYPFYLTDYFKKKAQAHEQFHLLDGYALLTLFYEPSTRIRLSFESAMHRLGGHVITVLEVLQPCLQESDVQLRGKVILGTVQGDLHDSGKNLVGMMLEGSGFVVTDLGTNVSTTRFVESGKTEKPNIVGMSALLTTTMGQMRHVEEVLSEAGLRDSVKVMVGGAPITSEWAKEIGADAYGATAPAAVLMAKQFTDGSRRH